jgi:hypothetical protein
VHEAQKDGLRGFGCDAAGPGFFLMEFVFELIVNFFKIPSAAVEQDDNPLFPALRSAPTAVSGASRRKQIPSRPSPACVRGKTVMKLVFNSQFYQSEANSRQPVPSPLPVPPMTPPAKSGFLSDRHALQGTHRP